MSIDTIKRDIEDAQAKLDQLRRASGAWQAWKGLTAQARRQFAAAFVLAGLLGIIVGASL